MILRKFRDILYSLNFGLAGLCFPHRVSLETILSCSMPENPLDKASEYAKDGRLIPTAKRGKEIKQQ